MNLFQLEDDKLFDALGDAVEPIIAIYESEKVTEILKIENEKVKKAKILVVILRDFKPEAKQILAALNGVPVDKFKCNFMTLSNGIMEVLNNKEIMGFFTSLLQTLRSFSSVMENTEDEEK